MSCTDDCEGPAPTESPRLLQAPEIRASLAGWVLIAGALVVESSGSQMVATALYGAGILCAGFLFAREAIEELTEGHVGIELLMTLAIAGAAALGQWREAALVAGLYSISEALEGYTLRRTRHAIRGLMALVPPTARVLRDEGESEVPVDQVAVGDRVVVRPGEALPVDGRIREGRSAIDESPVTGESLPAERGPGDEVFAGTINREGALVVEVTAQYVENTIHRIIALVEQAQAQKGRTQLFVERFGAIYSPAVLGAATLVAVVPIALGLEAGEWARKAVSLLVAASPCALAVATPVTLVAAIGSAAKRGILIKGGVALESLGRVRAVALDKTGTLTFGRPEVTGVLALEASEADVLSLAASVEHYSEHPLGRAIVGAARARGLALRPVDDFTAVVGSGVRGRVDGAAVAVLKPDEAGASLPAAAREWAEAARDQARTIVHVFRDERLVGALALADTLRPEAATLVASLGAVGVRHVVMLTGDNARTAQAIAAQACITKVHAGLRPEEKLSRLVALREQYGTVLMVGDGINDAPALAAASVGVAMGTGGSDAALSAADVALVGDDLSKLCDAIDLGRRSRRIIGQNIAAALFVVVVLVLGTFFGDLTMFGAVVGHEGSEVLIILNGMRVALGKTSV